MEDTKRGRPPQVGAFMAHSKCLKLIKFVLAICLISVLTIQVSLQITQLTEDSGPHQSINANQDQVLKQAHLKRSSEISTGTNEVAARGPTQAIGSAIDQSGAFNRQRRSPQAGQFNVMAPKLVQWSKEPVQYYEGSTLVLSCSLSVSGGEQPQLRFAWFRNNKPLTQTNGNQQQQQRLSIETLADYSFLRLADLRPGDAGAYTCLASNSLGQEDRTTTQVTVNVKLKWLPNTTSSASINLHQDNDFKDHGVGLNKSLVAPGEFEGRQQFVKSRAGQTVVFECNASGGSQPRPRVRWFRRVPISGHLEGARSRMGGGSHRQGSGKSLQDIQGGLLDESQIKLILSQLDAPHADNAAIQMQRFELHNDGVQDKPTGQSMLLNDSFNGNLQQQQLKWHIETTSTPVGGGGGGSNIKTNGQHEIFSRLILERVEPSASGFYECEVGGQAAAFDINGHHQQQQQQHLANQESSSMLLTSSSSSINRNQAQQSGDKLSRLFGLLVNGLVEVNGPRSSWTDAWMLECSNGNNDEINDSIKPQKFFGTIDCFDCCLSLDMFSLFVLNVCRRSRRLLEYQLLEFIS